MPTISEPPITKWPKASITLPAYPSSSTSRVALTLSARRNSVATRISAGKAEKSRGRRTNIAVIRISIAPVMLAAISMSSSSGGSGTTSMTTTATTATGTPTWARRFCATNEAFQRFTCTGTVPGASRLPSWRSVLSAGGGGT